MELVRPTPSVALPTPHAAERSAPAAPQRMRYWTWWLPPFALLWLVTYLALAPEPAAAAASYWPLVLVGLVGAFLGNATAVGGGLVFVPVMILFYKLSPVAALQLALASQAFGMTSGAVGWWQRGTVSRNLLRATAPAMLIGCTLSTVVVRPNAVLVKGLIGPVSILIGFVILQLARRSFDRADVPAGKGVELFLTGLVGGLLTGWVAVGVGEVVAAFLMAAYGLRADRSIGLGVVLLSIASIYLLGLHALVVGGVPWIMASFTILGCVFGARLGPYLSQWIEVRWLKILFAAVAIGNGSVFLVQFFLK